ncbi:MAG: hypothetical protein NWE83_02555 [Candidatus Bathyarchaeota archaeon]|nr:hypothetical protein [Candidatus Bathyarchaeota archaeon]
MTVIRCKRSPAINPYVAMTTGMVKGCPQHNSIELDKCRDCTNFLREE